jgi:GST-like protein
MALTLYGHDNSGSAAVEAALALAGQPFRLVQAASWAPDSALDELRRANPLEQIPTLVWDDGTVMTESAAILIELGLRHPASGLLPEEASARARALRGLVYVAANCYATIGVIDFPERVLAAPSEAEARRVVQRSRERLHALWEGFADQFAPAAGAPFLAGAAPGALDLLATTVSRWSGARAHLQAARPALSALFARVEQHAVVGPVFQRHWPPADQPTPPAA